MWIIIDEGPDRGKSAEVKGSPFTIGRADDNTFVFSDEEVSSHHAEITSEGGSFTLRDLGSTNGTFLNGARVEGAVPLNGGETLGFGQSKGRAQLRSPDATVIHRESPAQPDLPPPAESAPVPGGEVSRVVRGTVEESPRAAAAPAAQKPERSGPNPALIGGGIGVVVLIVVAVVVVLLVTGGSNKKKGPVKLTTAQVIKRSTPSVVRIQGDQGAGSGILINAKKGLVLTNAHVVVGNSALTAQVGNNTQQTSPLQVVAADPCDDIAVTRLVTPIQGLKPLTFGNANALQPGSNVTVLGFPGSLQESLSGDQTKGQATSVVSGTGAVSQVGVKADPDPSLPTYQDTIVHQAPVNHGDSGGPLLNQYGQVVGMNTLTNVEDQSQYYAISAAYIKRLLPMLEAGHSRGLVGWDLAAITPDDPDLKQELYDLYKSLPAYSDEASFYAEQVADAITTHHIKGLFDAGDQPGSAAATANVAGDLITSVNGDPVSSLSDVCGIVSSLNTGDSARVSGIQLVPNNPYDLGNATNVDVKISSNS